MLLGPQFHSGIFSWSALPEVSICSPGHPVPSWALPQAFLSFTQSPVFLCPCPVLPLVLPCACWYWNEVPRRIQSPTLSCLGESGSVSRPCWWHHALPTLLTPTLRSSVLACRSTVSAALNHLQACIPSWNSPMLAASCQDFRRYKEKVVCCSAVLCCWSHFSAS